MEGKRNVFSAVVPERGDLLTSAMIVLTTIQNPESMVLDTDCYPYDLIDNIEVRLNGQCIQRITKDLLDFHPIEKDWYFDEDLHKRWNNEVFSKVKKIRNMRIHESNNW